MFFSDFLCKPIELKAMLVWEKFLLVSHLPVAHTYCGITMLERSGTGLQRQLDSCTCKHAKGVLDHATAQSNPVSNLEEWTVAYAE